MVVDSSLCVPHIQFAGGYSVLVCVGLCFVMHHLVSFLVFQSSSRGRDS